MEKQKFAVVTCDSLMALVPERRTFCQPGDKQLRDANRKQNMACVNITIWGGVKALFSVIH